MKAIDKAKLDLDAKIAFDEEHSLYDLVIPGTPARPGDRKSTGPSRPLRNTQAPRASATGGGGEAGPAGGAGGGRQGLGRRVDRPPFYRDAQW